MVIALALIIVAPSDWRVIPGQSVGRVKLGTDSSRLTALLGRPRASDAAMQKQWSTWIGTGGGRLDVFSAGDGVSNPKVRLVRATSNRFRLANGLRPGSSPTSLRRAYPRAKAVSSYTASSGRVTIWDDAKSGLGWEVAGGRSLSLFVHGRGVPVTPLLGPYVSEPLPR